MTRSMSRADLRGPAGQLEALWLHAVEPRCGKALVCHPHPQHGGTMHTKAVYRTSRGLEAAGFSVLRFNFRGVGRSEGQFDHGRGELEDARQAWQYLTAQQPQSFSILGGFSFGSHVALRLGLDDPNAQALLGIGLPLAEYDFSFLDHLNKPLLVVVGDQDPFCPLNLLDDLQQRLGSALTAIVLPNTGHLLTERLPELQEHVQGFALKVLGNDDPT